MWKAATPYRSLYVGLGIALALAALLGAGMVLAIQAVGAARFLTAILVGSLAGWAVRRWRRPDEPKSGAWSYASAMTYGLPASPPFRSLEGHQRAVQRVFALRHFDADGIAARTGLPRRFVEAVLSYLDDDRDEGGAGVGARLRPKGPGPLSAER